LEPAEFNSRVRELEDLLGRREIIDALAYTSLHYSSNNRPEDAKRLRKTLNEIVDMLNDS